MMLGPVSGVWIRLDVDGDCRNCDFAGTVDAHFFALENTAFWDCPGCGSPNDTEVPVEDPDDWRD